LQPGAVVFSDVGPGVRWVGNEKGIAGETCWSTMRSNPESRPGQWSEELGRTLNEGVRGGDVWRPAESDVSIRPGWFWHENENDQVRSPENLVELYFQSVGRNSLMLLNVPPMPSGEFHPADVASIKGFRQRIDQIFAENLLKGA